MSRITNSPVLKKGKKAKRKPEPGNSNSPNAHPLFCFSLLQNKNIKANSSRRKIEQNRKRKIQKRKSMCVASEIPIKIGNWPLSPSSCSTGGSAISYKSLRKKER